MRRVCLTGNIASGKSTVVRVWERLGAHVIDADVLARRAVEPGSPGLAAVASAFGESVLAQDGSLDRAALRDVVFNDAAARARLEAIVHPEVQRLRTEAEVALERSGVNVVVHDIPLLFEAALEHDCDVIVLVDADAEVRLQRIIANRGVPEDVARQMIAAQMPAEQKRARASLIIDNNDTIDALERAAEQIWRKISGG